MTSDNRISIEDQLLAVHGDGLCHICGKPRTENGNAYCSYPHRRLPTGPRAPGMMAWKEVDANESEHVVLLADGSLLTMFQVSGYPFEPESN
jgi:hypothetical protein